MEAGPARWRRHQYRAHFWHYAAEFLLMCLGMLFRVLIPVSDLYPSFVAGTRRIRGTTLLGAAAHMITAAAKKISRFNAITRSQM